TLEVIGSAAQQAGASVSGNSFTNKAGSGATSIGFSWTPPDGKSADGLAWTEYEKVRVTIKIASLKQPAAGLSYNAKSDRAMGTDVNRFGETAQYANGILVKGGVGDENYADYPVSGIHGEIAFQYNAWEGDADMVAGGGIGTPSHKIEVSFMFYTGTLEGEEPEEPEPFVAVTGITLTGDLAGGTPSAIKDIAFEVKGTVDNAADATNTKIVWTLVNDATNIAEADWYGLDTSYSPPREVAGLVLNNRMKASKPGTFKLRATVVGGKAESGSDRDFVKDFTVTVNATPIDANAINFTNASQISAVGAGAAVTLIGNKGFKYTATDQNYQGNFACFPVTLPAGINFQRSAFITFDFEGKAGDYLWKNLELWAGADQITTAQWGNQPVVHTSTSQYKGNQDGGPKEAMQINIDVSKLSTVGVDITTAAKTAYFVIYIPAGAPAIEYEITNLKFFYY
ncbi:MAG: hypothetical protein LBI04_09955, partial [Treponema sp.]|nr:hypothetical protein [Treponema sp.]